MITTKDIVRGQGFHVHTQQLIRNSIFEEIATVSRTKNPLCNIYSRDFRRKDKHNALDDDTSGAITTAKAFVFNTTLTQNELYSHNGLTFFTSDTDTNIPHEQDFIEALKFGKIIPYTNGYTNETHMNLDNHKVEFWLNTLRGEAKLRALGTEVSIEALQDLVALSNDPDALVANSIIEPCVNDINREVCYRLMQLSQRVSAFHLSEDYENARNLIMRIERESQAIFNDAGIKGNNVVCDSETLAHLLGTGWLHQDVDEYGFDIPNRYYSETGLLFMANDVYKGFRYVMVSAKAQDGDIINCPIHLHIYQPDGQDIQVLETIDTKNMQPIYRSSARYTVMVAPYNNTKRDKIVNADLDSAFAEFEGHHPMVRFMPIEVIHG